MLLDTSSKYSHLLNKLYDDYRLVINQRVVETMRDGVVSGACCWKILMAYGNHVRYPRPMSRAVSVEKTRTRARSTILVTKTAQTVKQCVVVGLV